MKNLQVRALLTGFLFFAGIWNNLASQSEIVKLEAIASYYGTEFNGRPTANGEVFDMNALTAAHKTLPFGTILEVTNLENGKKAVVRVNDRGPFVEGRELDVSQGAAVRLGMIGSGTAKVSIRRITETGITAADTAAPVRETAHQIQVTAASPIVQGSDNQVLISNTVTTSPVMVSGVYWRIQLGSFAEEDNANRFVVRLRKDGFNPSFEKNTNLTRVVLSGIPDGELETLKLKLKNAGYDEYLVRQESR